MGDPFPAGPVITDDDAEIEVLPLRWQQVQIRIYTDTGRQIGVAVPWDEAIRLALGIIDLAKIASTQDPRPGVEGQRQMALADMAREMADLASAQAAELTDGAVSPRPQGESPAQRADRAVIRPDPAPPTGRFAGMTDPELAAIDIRTLAKGDKTKLRVERSARKRRDQAARQLVRHNFAQ